jgi:hemolysin activation/secretion protein
VVRGNFLAEFRPTPRITLSVAPRWQYARQPLVGFEEISGGNYTAGRAYDPGVITGDRGVGFQMEIRYGHIVPRSRSDAALQPYLFMDREWVWNINNPTKTLRPDPQYLSSMGGGIRASLGRLGRLDVSVAVPRVLSGFQMKEGPVRVLFSLTSRLWPR